MRDRQPDNLALDLLKGAVAGVVATWIMDRVDWAMYRREDPKVRRRTRAVRPEGKDPAHVIASKAARAVGLEPPPQDHPAGVAVHYAIGIAPAVVYGAARRRLPAVTAGRGLALGLGVFIAEDEIANPLLGFSAPPQRYPWQPHARGLVSHLVYGVVTHAVLDLLDRSLQTPRREPARNQEPVRYRRPG